MFGVCCDSGFCTGAGVILRSTSAEFAFILLLLGGGGRGYLCPNINAVGLSQVGLWAYLLRPWSTVAHWYAYIARHRYLCRCAPGCVC